MRAILDTNVLVSAVLSRESPPSAILQAWHEDRFQLVASAPLMNEFLEILDRPCIANRLGWSADERRLFLDAFDKSAIVVAPDFELHIVDEDQDDNRVLEAAQAAKVDHVVSENRHLVHLGNHEGISIVTPARFVAILTVS